MSASSATACPPAPSPLREMLGLETDQCLKRLRRAAYYELQVQTVRALAATILTDVELQYLQSHFQGFSALYTGSSHPALEGDVGTGASHSPWAIPDSVTPQKAAERIAGFTLARFDVARHAGPDTPENRRAYVNRIRPVLQRGFDKTCQLLSESPAAILGEIHETLREIETRLEAFALGDRAVKSRFLAPLAFPALAG